MLLQVLRDTFAPFFFMAKWGLSLLIYSTLFYTAYFVSVIFLGRTWLHAQVGWFFRITVFLLKKFLTFDLDLDDVTKLPEPEVNVERNPVLKLNRLIKLKNALEHRMVLLDAERYKYVRLTEEYPKAYNFTYNYKNKLTDMTMDYYNIFSQLPLLFLIVIIVGMCSILYLLYTLKYKRMVVKMLRKNAFFIDEALIPGSSLAQGVIPSYQIQIVLPGLFSDTHIGFGLRVSDDILVVPTHVWEKFNNSKTVGLKGKSGVAYIPNNDGVKARALCDLMFVKISSKVFGTIGASIGTLANELIDGQMAEIVGQSSDGNVCSSKGKIGISRTMKFMYTYRGSTLEGYSGAAYAIGSRILGVHVWSSTNTEYKNNYGFTSKAILMEMNSLFEMEDTNSEMMRQYSLQTKKPTRMSVEDEYKELKDLLEKKYGTSTTWAEEVEEESALTNLQTDTLKSVMLMNQKEREAFISLLTGKQMVREQSADSVEVEVQGKTIFQQLNQQISDQMESYKKEISQLYVNVTVEYLAGIQTEINILKGKLTSLTKLVEENQVNKIKKEKEPVVPEEVVLPEKIKPVVEPKVVTFAEKVKEVKEVTKEDLEVKIEPSTSKTTEQEIVIKQKLVGCPLCNRVFMSEEAMLQHVNTAARHQDIEKPSIVKPEAVGADDVKIITLRNPATGTVSTGLIRKESAQVSDYEKMVKTVPKKLNFTEGASKKKKSKNSANILTSAVLKQRFL